MCMVVYAASDAPLPLLPDDGPVQLWARGLEGREDRVRKHFTKPHVVYLGSHTGCSCGFSYGHSSASDIDARESVGALGRYLAEAVERGGPVEVYACWTGDEGREVAKRVTVTPAFFAPDSESFDLEQRWLAIVTAQR